MISKSKAKNRLKTGHKYSIISQPKPEKTKTSLKANKKSKRVTTEKKSQNNYLRKPKSPKVSQAYFSGGKTLKAFKSHFKSFQLKGSELNKNNISEIVKVARGKLNERVKSTENKKVKRLYLISKEVRVMMEFQKSKI